MITEQLEKDERVAWAEQQIMRPRIKKVAAAHQMRYWVKDPLERGLKEPLPKRNHLFNDPLWNYQWYEQDLNNLPNAAKGDMRVLEAWKLGFTGKGIVVSVIDDGKCHL